MGRANVNNKVPTAIVQMIHSLHVMICMLMSPQKYGKTEINNAVKLFLSCSHQFTKTIGQEMLNRFGAELEIFQLYYVFHHNKGVMDRLDGTGKEQANNLFRH